MIKNNILFPIPHNFRGIGATTNSYTIKLNIPVNGTNFAHLILPISLLLMKLIYYKMVCALVNDSGKQTVCYFCINSNDHELFEE